MAGAANGQIQVGVSYTNPITTNTAGSANDQINVTKTIKLANGTAAGQIDDAASLGGTLTNTTAVVTLSAVPSPGGTKNFNKVRVLTIFNDADPAAGGNSLTVQANDTQGWVAAFGGVVTIPAGGSLTLVAPTAVGYPVVAGTTDKFKVGTTGTSVPYRVVVMGASI